MSRLPLFRLVLALSAPTAAAEELPMPAPPPGMKLLEEEDAQPLEEPAAPAEPREAEEPGEPPEEGEAADAQTQELEELRALEDVALDPEARPSAEVLQALRRLGYANPLRARMLDVLGEEDDSGAAAGEPVGLATDLLAFDVKRIASGFDIPVEMQPLVAKYIRFFQGPGRKYYRRWVERSARYIPLMQPLLEKHGCPRDTVYLAMIESGFSNRAYSWAHASGPWQFISETGKRFGLHQDFWVDERRDPLKATVAAARYLKELHGQLGHWYLAWAGYNAGGGRIRKAVDRRGTTNFWELLEGRALPRETQHYVPKLIAAALVGKYPEVFGFSRDEFHPEPLFTYDEVKVPHPTDVALLAEAAGVSVATLEDLNPELKRCYSPPPRNGESWVMRVPRGLAAAFRANYAKLPEERLAFRSHVVRRGETLSKIAASHGSAPEAVMRLNGLKSARYLKVNTALMIPVATGKEHRAALMAAHVARAHREGFFASRPKDEVPAGVLQRAKGARGGKAGTVKVDVVGGKKRVLYGVGSGDSLWSISQRFGVTVEELRAWNNLPRGKRGGMKVGHQLVIWPSGKAAAAAAQKAAPGGKNVQPVQAGPGRHTIQAGDSLSKIAKRYGVSVAQLRKWNGLAEGKTLLPGRILSVKGD